MAKQPKKRSKKKQNTSRTSSAHKSTSPSASVRDEVQSAEAPHTRRERLKARAEQLKHTKALEGGVALRDNVKSRWARVKERGDQLWAWYLQRPMYQRVLWGLIVIPIVLLIVAINLFLVPIIAPFLPLIGAALITGAKALFVITKVGAFAVYIGYKILKTCLGIYYCVSRTLSGWRAGKVRTTLATHPISPEPVEGQVKGSEALSALSWRASWKRLWLEGELPWGRETHTVQHPLLFSYLRYFLIGQVHMYVETWRERKAVLTAWRAESRETLKDQFGFVGATIFRPHSIGPHVNAQRVLIPGDARLLSVELSTDVLSRPTLTYHLEVPWRTWSFNRHWPFAHSELHTARWAVELPHELSALTEDDLGWRPEAVLELGGPRVDDQGDELKEPEQTTHTPNESEVNDEPQETP